VQPSEQNAAEGLHHFFEGQMPRDASARPKHLPFKKTPAFFFLTELK
jgi:hypothetical protein